jgi:CDP-diacylglycerol--serine O-phosphatidyltransferase
MRSKGFRHGVALLPSLFTLANLFCGWSAVVYAMRGELETAAPFIGVAMVLDMLDGRIARMTGTASEFGLQLDSLADIVSFGMAPAVLAYAWGLAPLGRLGWAVGFLFVTAAALRLARFNIQKSSDKRYFVGRSAREAAGLPHGGPGSGAGAVDGQHDPVPQFQNHRHRHPTPLSITDRGSGGPQLAHYLPAGSPARDGLYLSRIGVRRAGHPQTARTRS